LEEDHRQVEEWFDEYDELKEDDDRKAELAQKICLALKVHAQIDELKRVPWSPAVRRGFLPCLKQGGPTTPWLSSPPAIEIRRPQDLRVNLADLQTLLARTDRPERGPDRFSMDERHPSAV
jgi:hypothetical protein